MERVMNDLEYGRDIIKEEGEALNSLAENLDDNFQAAINAIMQRRGRVIVTGMGKSGHIAKKIAATFASTGTPALFVHPAEASHGDLGMIAQNDIVIALSKSGESPELHDIINYCKRFSVPIIAITQEKSSSLGLAADFLLGLPIRNEAGPYNLAPTTSTTLSIVFGDALAMCVMRRRNFAPQQFKNFHPGGKLGQKLTRANDIMQKENLPLVKGNMKIFSAAVAMSQGLKGCVGITDEDGRLIGIFTDGDLRKRLGQSIEDIEIKEVMTKDPQMAAPDDLISEIANRFSEKKISSVFVCEAGKPVGIIHLQDLLSHNFI